MMDLVSGAREFQNLADREGYGKPDDKFVRLYPFTMAPKEWQALSRHGGDEDWVVFAPDSLEGRLPWWLEVYQPAEDEIETEYAQALGWYYPPTRVEGGWVWVFAHA